MLRYFSSFSLPFFFFLFIFVVSSFHKILATEDCSTFVCSDKRTIPTYNVCTSNINYGPPFFWEHVPSVNYRQN
jgi:hypothetical protein